MKDRSPASELVAVSRGPSSNGRSQGPQARLPLALSEFGRWGFFLRCARLAGAERTLQCLRRTCLDVRSWPPLLLASPHPCWLHRLSLRPLLNRRQPRPSRQRSPRRSGTSPIAGSATAHLSRVGLGASRLGIVPIRKSGSNASGSSRSQPKSALSLSRRHGGQSERAPIGRGAITGTGGSRKKRLTRTWRPTRSRRRATFNSRRSLACTAAHQMDA